MRYITFLIIALIGLVTHGQMVEGTAETYHSGLQTISTYYNNGKYELRDIDRNFDVRTNNRTPNALTVFDIQSGVNKVIDIDNNWGNLKSLRFLSISNLPTIFNNFTIEDGNIEIYNSDLLSDNNLISNQVYEFYGVQFQSSEVKVKFFGNSIFSNPIEEILNLDIGLHTVTLTNGMELTYEILLEPNYAVDVYINLATTYDYFQSSFNRNGLGGFSDNIRAFTYSGGDFRLALKAEASPRNVIIGLDNIFFGSGIRNFRKPFTPLEVVAHEYSHLILAREEKFQTLNSETKAINESIVDAFGICVKHFRYPNEEINWIINDFGLDDFDNDILRDLMNPQNIGMIYTYASGEIDNHQQTKTYGYVTPSADLVGNGILQGPNWVDSSYNLGIDAGYKNMGPANFWFYLIANDTHIINPKIGTNEAGTNYSVKSLGIEKAEQLLYYLITDSPYLGRDSKYLDYANASINAAEYFVDFNLHNFTNEDVQSIKNAWYAVGVLDNPNEFCNSGVILTETSGSLEDGSLNQNYNNDQNCSWTIAPNGASSVRLNFTDFDLGNGDSVVVYDGLNNTAMPIGTYVGTTIPDEIVSTTGAVFIEFTTDSVGVGQGWSLIYSGSGPNENCNTLTELFFASAVFDDGSGSSNYLNNSSCSWRIAPENATFINLDFQFINLENNKDFVTIYDGLDEFATPLGTFTGNNIPNTIIANSGTAFVKFTSNNLNTSEGWAISYTSDGIEPCFGTTILTNATATVSDGSGTDNYGNNADCSWLIQPENATSITLVFDELKLQEVTSDGNTTTLNDYLAIYDGDEALGEPIALYSGSQLLPLIVQSSGGSLFVKFVSNNSITDVGWQFTYTSSTDDFCSGTTVLNSDTGTITDGSATDNYKSNSDCRWLIQPENATSIELNLTFLDTELGKDGIVVYDGPNTTYPYTSYSGINLPETIYSSGGAVLISFLSDAQNEFGGFELNYVANISPEGNANSIVSYEYWFNDDYTNAVKANNFGAVNTLSLNLQSNTANLPNGLNILNIRTKDIIGNWSSVVSEYIYVQNSTASGTNKITEYEYWYNDDYISKVSGIGTDTSTLLLSLQSGVGTLEKGLHQFHIRFKDEKRLWSSIVSEFIYVNNPEGLGNNNIVAYKYWFNDDYENRTSESVDANENLFFIENIDISGLENSSSNFIHFQFKDTYGNWSSVITEEFFFQTLSNNGFDSKEFDVYPNPSNGDVFLITNQIQGTLTIYNNLGQQIQSLSYIPEKLNINSFNSGIYIFKIENKNGVYQKKIIKY